MNNFEDLIVVGENKFAIFNKVTCKYLTKKIYDSILLSPSGNHILTKIKKNKESIDYICYIFNENQILQCPNLIFKDEFIKNTAIAFSKDSQKKHLVNNKGIILSNGFDFIEHIAGTLYQAQTYSQDKKRIENINILNNNGEILPLTFDDFKTEINPTLNEIQTFEDLLTHIDKYGIEITHISNFRPKSMTEILLLFNTSINYIKKNNLDLHNLFYLVSAYKNVIHYKNFNIDIPKENFDFDLSFFKINRIELNNIKKYIINELIEPIYNWHTK